MSRRSPSRISRFTIDREAFVLPPGDYLYIEETMAQTQARMTALVGRALQQTLDGMKNDVVEIVPSDLSAQGAEPQVKELDHQAFAAIFTGHLCALLYPKQDPDKKEG